MTAHEFLTNEGVFTHTHYDEEVWDSGGPESGPIVHCDPAYDEYAGESHYFVLVNGVLVHREPRDFVHEAWLIEMEGQHLEEYEL